MNWLFGRSCSGIGVCDVFGDHISLLYGEKHFLLSWSVLSGSVGEIQYIIWSCPILDGFTNKTLFIDKYICKYEHSMMR